MRNEPQESQLRMAPFACFRRAESGLAAIEFAFLAPIMILLFLGVIESSNALSVSRKVTLAVNTLTDLASQETQLKAQDAEDLFTGVEQIIAQGDIDADIRLVSLILDPDSDEVVVHWSRDNSGAEPYAPGAAYSGLTDTALLDENSSLIVGEIRYEYIPPITKVVIGAVEFNRMATRWPRRSSKVQFCSAPGVCTG